MKYRLSVESPAESDLESISSYIAETLNAPLAAIDFLDEVEAC